MMTSGLPALPRFGDKFESNWRHKRLDLELAKALKLQDQRMENDRRYVLKKLSKSTHAVPDTYTNTYKESKSQNGKTAETGSAGYVASPQSEQFKKWKAWAYEQSSRAFWRELQQREIEGRSFNFETQWPSK